MRCNYDVQKVEPAMPKRVDIVQKQEVLNLNQFFRVEETKLRYERFDGQMSDTVTRFNLNRGDSAAALVHDPKADTILLVEQFRYSTYDKGPGWLLELPAGVIKPEEADDPKKTIQREIKEESGYDTESLKHVSTFYVSPGGTSERIFLYYAKVTPKNRTSDGGGLVKEGENTRVMMMKLDAAVKKITSGDILDAKTIIGLQWLQLNKTGLK
jgi:nudix-type nucleoside diphosphatase (YffH/AdpP family)